MKNKPTPAPYVTSHNVKGQKSMSWSACSIGMLWLTWQPLNQDIWHIPFNRWPNHNVKGGHTLTSLNTAKIFLCKTLLIFIYIYLKTWFRHKNNFMFLPFKGEGVRTIIWIPQPNPFIVHIISNRAQCSTRNGSHLEARTQSVFTASNKTSRPS